MSTESRPELPAGAPRWVTLDGILDGRIKDGPAIAAAVATLNGLGICRFELEQDGGRFTLLPANDRVAGAGFDEARQNELLEQLRKIAGATNGAVESTLRCTMIYESEVAETLFRGTTPPPAGDGVEPLTRVRPLAASDTPPELPKGPPVRQLLRRREVVIVVPLLIVAFGLMAWQTGLLDRLLAASARGLVVETAAFGDLLTAEVESSWGNYKVTIRRGAGYPADRDAWDARAAVATNASEADRLRDRIVREGDEICCSFATVTTRCSRRSRCGCARSSPTRMPRSRSICPAR